MTITAAQLGDPWWRLTNLYRIVNDQGENIPFAPFEQQRELYEQLRLRNVILKGRQQGFTTFVDLMLLDQCLFNENFTGAIIAHSLPDAQRFFRTKVLGPYNSLPDVLRTRIPIVKETGSELVFQNGSAISVSTSARGGTVHFLHVSEMGKIARKYPEKAREIVSGAFEAVPKNGIIVVESTAEGKDGWFYDACITAHRRQQAGGFVSSADFFLHFFPWFRKRESVLNEPVVIETDLLDYFAETEAKIGLKLTKAQRAWYAKKLAVLGEDMKREYPSTVEEAFESAFEGAFYSKQMAALRKMGRIGPVPVRPGVEINTFWDFGVGVGNETAIWFHQRVGAMNRFVNFHQKAGEGLRYFWNKCEEFRVMVDGRWGTHYLPHDGRARVQGDQVQTRKEILEELGARHVQVVKRIGSNQADGERLMDGIEATRTVLLECEFDERNCSEGIACLDNYCREWDEDAGVWLSKPRHDKFSNGADAFRQFAQGYRLGDSPSAMTALQRRMAEASPPGLYSGSY